MDYVLINFTVLVNFYVISVLMVGGSAMKIRSLGIGICLSLFGTFCLGGCSGSPPQPVSRTVTVFDTVVTITVYDKDSEDVLDACVAKCEDYNARFSRTSEGSEIYELNHANGEPVTLSGDTVDLIQKGVEYSRLADGKFDITIHLVTCGILRIIRGPFRMMRRFRKRKVISDMRM